jgi:hypothetical protein
MPPECAVCGADAAPPGGLVRFVSRPEDLAWRERVERDRLVGHPPDEAWMCGAHVARARELASSLALADAVARLREGPTAEGAPSSLPIRPVGVAEVGARFRALAPAIAAALGVASPVLHERTTRHWHPMDGSVAPDCPYTDDTVWTTADSAITLSGSRAWWNDVDLARAHESLLARAPGASLAISGHIPADGSTDRVSELLVSGTLPPDVAALVRSAFPAL